MTSLFLRLSAIAVFAIFAFHVGADTLTLTDGQKLAGKILAETDDEVVMEVQVSPTIVDQKTVSKDEIDLIERTAQDEVAFQAIEAIEPGKDSLTPRAYERIISTRLKAFLDAYPDSPKAAVVREKMARFEEEKNRVESGEVKLDGRWLDQEEASEVRQEIVGRQIFAAMQETERRRDHLSALNAFDIMEREAPGASMFPDAVDLAARVLRAFQSELKQKLAAYERYRAEWQKGFDVSPIDRQQLLKHALDEERARAQAAMDQAKDSGRKWPPLFERYEGSILALEKTAADESKRIADFDTAKMRKSLALSSEAARLAAAADFEAAEARLGEAKTMWPKNFSATSLSAALPGMIAEAKARTEEAVKQAEAAQAEAETKAAEETVEKEEKTAAQAAAQAAAQSAQPTAGASENFFLTVPGAIAVLVAVGVALGVVSLIGRARKPARTGEADPPKQ